jgi:demethylmenaquinone methyltransferase/2-methoxy-6-polyprenyl-1,4-benzoquinol methylase
MDATALELPDGAFDEVLISLVLHELDETLAGRLIHEAKRVLKDSGRIVVTEWERQEKNTRRIIFAPIALLEPKPYKSFIRKDMYSFFAAFGLNVDEYIHCDYSRVLVLSKAGQENASDSDIRYLEQTKIEQFRNGLVIEV